MGGNQENIIPFPSFLPPPSVVFSRVSFPSHGIRLLIKSVHASTPPLVSGHALMFCSWLLLFPSQSANWALPD